MRPASTTSATDPAETVAESDPVALAAREKAKRATSPTRRNDAKNTTPVTSSANPNIGRGLRRSTWNDAPSSVPRVSGRSGMSPGFGGGVQPACGPAGGAGTPVGDSNGPAADAAEPVTSVGGCHGELSVTSGPL